MVEQLSEYANLIFAAGIAAQILLWLIPAALYMMCSSRQSIFILAGVIAAVHLCIVALVGAIVAVSGSPDAHFLWLAISMLDLPTTYLFPHFESALSMPMFFAVLGTIQYALAGLITGALWRKARGETVIMLLLPLLLASGSAHAAGPYTHMTIGQLAFDKYLVSTESIVSGFAEFRADADAMRAFYSGCTFPDTMQDGINGDAAEASHWYPFEKAYLEMVSGVYPPPWTQETRRNVAFYLGIVCHNVGDWPWHFDYGEHKSVITMAEEQEKCMSLDRVGEIFAHMDYVVRPDMAGRFWWPQDDALAAFRRATIPCSADDLNRGCPSQDAHYQMGSKFAAIAYPVFASQWPWTRKHMDGYYYGGVEHCAALCAMTIRHYFALLNGAYVYQNIPVEGAGFPKGQPFLPMSDDAGDRPYISFNEGAAREVTITINEIAQPKSGDVDEAILWLHFAGRGEGRQIDSVDITADPGDGGPAARAAILPTDEPDKWLAWDVTPQAQASLKQKKPCTIKLISEDLPGQPEIRFDSCAALQTDQSRFAGTRVAYRPILVVR